MRTVSCSIAAILSDVVGQEQDAGDDHEHEEDQHHERTDPRGAGGHAGILHAAGAVPAGIVAYDLEAPRH
jgi:hypothetical protein